MSADASPITAIMAELVAWLHTHPDLPTFCYGNLLHNTYNDSWDLTFRIPHTDNRQTLMDLARWAVALGALDISAPRPNGVDLYQHLTAAGRICDAVRVTIWGHLIPGRAEP